MIAVLGGVAACSTGDDGSEGGATSQSPDPANDAVPPELAPACGHPGTHVTLRTTKLPVTVNPSACDLAGVVIRWKDGTDTVPGGDVAAAETTCDDTSGASCPSVRIDKAGALTIEPAS